LSNSIFSKLALKKTLPAALIAGFFKNYSRTGEPIAATTALEKTYRLSRPGLLASA
jgi:hypothetical protein